MATGDGVVPAISEFEVDPETFTAEEAPYAYYLAHFSTLANAVVMEGPDPGPGEAQAGDKPRGFIDIKLWRRPQDNEPYNARILENHASLSFFYTEDRPWNVYRGNGALKARLEAVMERWCRCQNPDGRFAEYRPDNWSLAPTGFGVKFMGETLRRLKESENAGGPTVDAEILGRTAGAARKAIEVLLTHPDLLRHARAFSNQYTGYWGGLMAYLTVYPDADLERRFGEVVNTFGEELTSPVGYHYERKACDWRYTMGTHRSNVRHVYKYAKGSDLGRRIVELEEPWMDWLSYNAAMEPDGSYFTMNRAIETRTALDGFATWESPVGESIPIVSAYSQTEEEYAKELETARRDVIATWPEAGPLGAYSPHIFVDGHLSMDWRTSAAKRTAARKTLPFLAKDRYTHLRMDDREAVQFTYVRRPNYYAAFNSGELICDIQRYGLGLLWHPEMGTVMQAQSREAGSWGTAAGGGAAPGEAGAFQPAISVGGKAIGLEPGRHDLPDGDVEIAYAMAGGRKRVRFADEGIDVEAGFSGEWTEHLPVMVKEGDVLASEGGTLRLARGGVAMVVAWEGDATIETADTDVAHGPFRLVNARVTGSNALTYSIRFVKE